MGRGGAGGNGGARIVRTPDPPPLPGFGASPTRRAPFPPPWLPPHVIVDPNTVMPPLAARDANPWRCLPRRLPATGLSRSRGLPQVAPDRPRLPPSPLPRPPRRFRPPAVHRSPCAIGVPSPPPPAGRHWPPPFAPPHRPRLAGVSSTAPSTSATSAPVPPAVDGSPHGATSLAAVPRGHASSTPGARPARRAPRPRRLVGRTIARPRSGRGRHIAAGA